MIKIDNDMIRAWLQRATKEDIIASISAQMDEVAADERRRELINARQMMLNAVFEYIKVLDPNFRNMTEDEENDFYDTMEKKLDPIEKVLFGAAPTKDRKGINPDKTIIEFLKKNNLA
jgi:hypothetical protein